jgi:hypothetical protein
MRTWRPRPLDDGADELLSIYYTVLEGKTQSIGLIRTVSDTLAELVISVLFP